jgi:hypothetical protein
MILWEEEEESNSTRKGFSLKKFKFFMFKEIRVGMRQRATITAFETYFFDAYVCFSPLHSISTASSFNNIS